MWVQSRPSQKAGAEDGCLKDQCACPWRWRTGIWSILEQSGSSDSASGIAIQIYLWQINSKPRLLFHFIPITCSSKQRARKYSQDKASKRLILEGRRMVINLKYSFHNPQNNPYLVLRHRSTWVPGAVLGLEMKTRIEQFPGLRNRFPLYC